MTWILGILIGSILVFGGLSNRVTGLRASTKQLIAIMGFLVVVLAIAIMLDNMLHWWNRIPLELFGIVGVLIAGERTFRVVRSGRHNGAVVLDLGRVPVQDMIINLFLGAALAWFAVTDILAISHLSRWNLRYISIQILGLSLAYALFVQGLVKRKIMEQGLNYGTGFARWEQFERYDWERESVSSSTLLLHKRSSKLIFRLLILSIKAEHVQGVEEAIEHHNIMRIGGAPRRPVEGADESLPTTNS